MHGKDGDERRGESGGGGWVRSLCMHPESTTGVRGRTTIPFPPSFCHPLKALCPNRDGHSAIARRGLFALAQVSPIDFLPEIHGPLGMLLVVFVFEYFPAPGCWGLGGTGGLGAGL